MNATENGFASHQNKVMRVPVGTKLFAGLSVLVLSTVFILANFVAQTPAPSPTPAPEASPSPSPSPLPARAPSPTPLPGAQNFHQWGSVTVFNGLPSDSVRAISQTPDGVMWFGTDNGLARFDGRRIQNFSPGGSGTDRVLALETAPSGELWVGTQAGAFVYVNNRFQPVEGTRDLGITAIFAGPEVLLGTDAGLVLRVSTDIGGIHSASAFSDPVLAADGNPLSITSLIGSEGKLLASTAGRGVFIVADGGVSELSTLPRPLFVNAMASDQAGKLWLGADAPTRLSGVYRSGTGPRVERIPAPTANVLALETNDGGLWAGTERFGLFHITDAKIKKSYTFENTSGGLRSNTVYTLFTDREGVLWIGTNRGVSRFDRLGASQETISDIANSNFIRTLSHYGEGHTMYAGSNRGLFEFDGEEWIPVAALGNRTIYAIGWMSSDSEAPVVGTPEGLFDINGKLILPGDVRAINSFQGKLYAAVYGRGVVDVTAGSRLVFRHEAVTSLGGYVGKMLIGTDGNGLYSFDGNIVSLEFAPDILRSGTIWKSWEAGFETGALLAGQHGVFFTKDGTIEQIIAAEDVRDAWGVHDGPSDNLVDVWAATTSRGVLHGRKDKRFGWLVSSISFEQGLPSEKCFAILPTKEGLYVGTNRGIVIYKPGIVTPKLIPTRILSRRAHDLSEINSTVALEYPQNSLLIEVAGQSSRTFPEEFQYAFVLTNSKGEEIDRRISNEPQYAPAELKPGEYVIEAIAFNRDLLASDPLLFRFSVAKAPFPWTATALGVLLLVALAGLVWAFIEHRRISYRNRELARARLDLANEAERERRRISRDLHDQTLADLRSLMLMSDNAKPEISGFRDEIEAISGEVRRICEDLSPSVLENVGLVAALEFLLKGTIEKHQFTAPSNIEDDIAFPMQVQLQVYRIAQEVLANIKRHSNAGFVEMTLDHTADQFVLLIDDDGDQFNPASTPKTGRGIANIKARASIIAAVIEWTKRREGGNRFSLSIPKSV